MTIKALHAQLERLLVLGHGRKRVMIDKSTFSHPLESDGAVILDVMSAGVVSYPMLDDDGGIRIRKDRSESCHTSLVLRGDG